MGNVSVKLNVEIELVDVLKYLEDKYQYELESLGKEENEYLEGQRWAMKKAISKIQELTDGGWNTENVINNFYVLCKGDKTFEKKYKKIWGRK